MKAVMDQRAAERSYGIPQEHLTPTIGWSLPALRRWWNAVKGEVAPWWRDYSKEAYNTGLDALARALKNWAESRSGRRAGGRAVGFPRFKSRRRSIPSVRFTTGTIRVEPDRRHVVLPRLGRLRLHESARKLARRLQAGTARILSATVRRHGHRWYVSFTCHVERAHRTPARPDATVGVDLGVKHERTFTCTTCSLVLDRDVNAARNLAALAATVAGSGPETLNGRGADHKTPPTGPVAVKRPPGTATADKTGTVPPQGGTSDHELIPAS
ncbi:zinc ribbon domain-containing protein [Micromonospora thermarum]|uniref:zinc ribbon domain-containing protein n=1 Tax=Micromonospora thermarum TaxID=2720024 RepID=UPI00197BA304|nr:zinc ribbon domain-containing protein [Micromonospora thermarum]